MKRVYAIFLSILTFSLFSINITMKESVVIDKDFVTLKDVANEDISDTKYDIVLAENIEKNFILSNKDALTKLVENNIFDASIFGKQTVIALKKNQLKYNESASDKVSETVTTPVKFLENYLSDYIDSPNMKLSISINKVSKNFDLNSIKGDYKWEIDKLKKGLSDIINLKKVFINVDKARYLVELEVSVVTDIFISKKSFISGDYINKDFFIKKSVDIATYSDGDLLVFDINKADKSKFVKDFGAGEVLRWSGIKKIPLVVKGEELKIIIKKNRTTITIPCESMQDAYENEKIKVKLANKKEKIGILKERDGDRYVEI